MLKLAENAELIDRCEGPAWSGRCPRSEDGAPVACAGCFVVAEGPRGTRGVAFLVEPDATVCPLSSLQSLAPEARARGALIYRVSGRQPGGP